MAKDEQDPLQAPDEQDQSPDQENAQDQADPSEEGDQQLAEQDQQDPQAPQDPLADIDDDELSNYILELLRNDIRYKEQSGWVALREYDINAYEGNRRPTNFPWVNCSNFSVPLTPTLVDTAHANIMGSIFADPESTTDVQGVGVEDIRTAPLVGQLLNWELNTEINTYEEWDRFVFRSLLYGTGVLKIIHSYSEDKIVLRSVPIENIYVPLDAEGLQPQHTDHVIEVIALTHNDVEERKLMRNPKTGKPIYDGIEEVTPGMRIGFANAMDATVRVKDAVSGTKLYDHQLKDLVYLLECYVTYYPPSEDKSVANDPLELIVTMAPNGKKILRKELNEIKKRPYVFATPFPRDDRFYGRSLPEKIHQIQEELDYSHNQNINGADLVIAPPGFYDPTSGFDPSEHQIVPAGMYPSLDGKAPQYSERSLNPIFERQEDRYWDLAERVTGLTELFQGRAQHKGKSTLGEAKLRNNRTEIRFKALYQRYEKAWSDMVELIYFYNSIWMKPDKQIKVIGVGDYKKLSELFPKGMKGNYNFTFHNAPITEVEIRNKNKEEMCMEFFQMPIVQSNPGNLWRVMKVYSEVKGERNLEVMVSKPPEANILSAEEAIQRIMSGQYELVPEPGIDANNYILRIQLFMMTDTFKTADQEAKQAFMKLLRRVQQIAVGQLRGKYDGMILRQGDPREAALAAQNGQGDQPQPPGGPNGNQ